jgi:replicative DNA helicase
MENAQMSEGAEKAVIGHLFWNPSDALELGLEPSDMGSSEPRRALEAILSLSEAGNATDPLSVEIWTAANDGPSLIWDDIQKWSNGTEYGFDPSAAVAIIKDNALDREVRRNAKAIAADRTNTSVELLSEAQSSFAELGAGIDSGGTISLGDAVLSVLEDYQRAHSGDSPGSMSFGNASIDEYCLLDSGGVMVIAGRPSMGKSALCQYLSTGLADSGERIAVFTTEVSAKKAARRYLSKASRVNSTQIVTGKTTASEQENIGAAAVSLASPRIWFNDCCADAKSISAEIRKLKRVHGITVVVVDHVQECIDQEDPNREIGQLISMLRGVCREEPKTALILVSQLNRRVEQRESKQPNLSDLRDSGTIEQAADSVLLCYRPAYYSSKNSQDEDPGLMLVGVAKNRDGKTGVIPMQWDCNNGFVMGVRDGKYGK